MGDLAWGYFPLPSYDVLDLREHCWSQETPRAKPSMSLNGDQGTYTLSFEAVWKFTTKTSIGHALEEIPCQDVKEPYQYYFYKYYKKAALSVYLSTFNSCINAE